MPYSRSKIQVPEGWKGVTKEIDDNLFEEPSFRVTFPGYADQVNKEMEQQKADEEILYAQTPRPILPETAEGTSMVGLLARQTPAARPFPTTEERPPSPTILDRERARLERLETKKADFPNWKGSVYRPDVALQSLDKSIELSKRRIANLESTGYLGAWKEFSDGISRFVLGSQSAWSASRAMREEDPELREVYLERARERAARAAEYQPTIPTHKEIENVVDAWRWAVGATPTAVGSLGMFGAAAIVSGTGVGLIGAGLGALPGIYIGNPALAALGAKYGFTVGKWVGSMGATGALGWDQYAGDIYLDLIERGVEHELAAETASKYGLPAGVVSIIGPVAAINIIGKRMFLKDFMKQRARDAAISIAIGVPAQGSAEAAATQFTITGRRKHYEIPEEQASTERWESFLVGGMLGLMGIGGGVRMSGSNRTFTNAILKSAESFEDHAAIHGILVNHLSQVDNLTPTGQELLDYLKGEGAKSNVELNRAEKELKRIAKEVSGRSEEQNLARFNELLGKEETTTAEAMEITTIYAHSEQARAAVAQQAVVDTINLLEQGLVDGTITADDLLVATESLEDLGVSSEEIDNLVTMFESGGTKETIEKMDVINQRAEEIKREQAELDDVPDIPKHERAARKKRLDAEGKKLEDATEQLKEEVIKEDVKIKKERVKKTVEKTEATTQETTEEAVTHSIEDQKEEKKTRYKVPGEIDYSKVRPELLDVFDFMDGFVPSQSVGKLRRAKKFNVFEYNLGPGEPAQIPATWHDGAFRYTILKHPDGTLEQGASGSYDTVLMSGHAARSGEGFLPPGYTAYFIDLGPGNIRTVRIYRSPSEQATTLGTETLSIEDQAVIDIETIELTKEEERVRDQMLRRVGYSVGELKRMTEEQKAAALNVAYDQADINDMAIVEEYKKTVQGPPIEIPETKQHPLRENPKRNAELRNIYLEMGDKVLKDPDMMLGRVINEFNSYLDGVEGIDGERIRTGIQELFLRSEEFKYMFDSTAAFNDWKDSVGQAAKWIEAELDRKKIERTEELTSDDFTLDSLGLQQMYEIAEKGVKKLGKLKKGVTGSVGLKESELLKDITRIHTDGKIDADITYSKGAMWRGTGIEPKYKFDKRVQVEGVVEADTTVRIPLEDNSVNSIMFDPPFIAAQPSKMRYAKVERFTGYRNINELWDYMKKSLAEVYRVLEPGGKAIVKIQDVAIDVGSSTRQNYFTSAEMYNFAVQLGFKPVDRFINVKENPYIPPGMTGESQKMARKMHSDYWVFEKPAKKYKHPTESGVHLYSGIPGDMLPKWMQNLFKKKSDTIPEPPADPAIFEGLEPIQAEYQFISKKGNPYYKVGDDWFDRKGKKITFKSKIASLEKGKVVSDAFIVPEQERPAVKPRRGPVKEMSRELLWKRRGELSLDTLRSNRLVEKIRNELSTDERTAIIFMIEKTGIPRGLMSEEQTKKVQNIIDTQGERLKPYIDEIQEHFKEGWQRKKLYLPDMGHPQIVDYVTHIWDIPRNKRAQVATWFSTQDRFLNKRFVETIKEGVERYGLVPKTLDIADIIVIHDTSVNKAVANARYINALKMMSDLGMPVILEKSDKAPIDYVEYNHPAINRRVFIPAAKEGEPGLLKEKSVVVHPDLVRPLDVILGSPAAIPGYAGYAMINGFLKKSILTISFFHHFALAEVGVSMGVPLHKMLNLYLNPVKMYNDLINGNLEAYQDSPIMRRAAKAGVQFGTTADIPVQAFQRMLDTMAFKTKNIPLINNVTELGKHANQLWDRALWAYLHDTLKLYAFESMVNKIDMTKDVTKQEREIAQIINDTFGGQFWELVQIRPGAEGVTPAELQLLTGSLLSADWTVSTIRQALSPFGVGKVYKESGHIRKKIGRAFWLRVALWFGLGMNLLNMAFRKWDRDNNPEYYEEEEFDLMDYTMFGNTIGQKTYLFAGRYEDGSERYIRWGKQFRELFELGLSPLTKMGGKAAPVPQTLSMLFAHKSLTGFKNDDLYGKRGWEYFEGIFKTLIKSPIPLSLRKIERGDIEWKATDLFMPSSKGLTRAGARNYFIDAIKDGSIAHWALDNAKTEHGKNRAQRNLDNAEDVMHQTWIGCLRNNLPPAIIFTEAMRAVEAQMMDEMSKTVKGVEDARALRDEAETPLQRRRANRLYARKLREQADHRAGLRALKGMIKKVEATIDWGDEYKPSRRKSKEEEETYVPLRPPAALIDRR